MPARSSSPRRRGVGSSTRALTPAPLSAELRELLPSANPAHPHGAGCADRCLRAERRDAADVGQSHHRQAVRQRVRRSAAAAPGRASRRRADLRHSRERNAGRRRLGRHAARQCRGFIDNIQRTVDWLLTTGGTVSLSSPRRPARSFFARVRPSMSAAARFSTRAASSRPRSC